MSDIDSLIELAKLAASRHDQRRQYEWKVSLTLWALIVGASVRNEIPKVPIWVGIIIGSLYAFFWLRGLWVANENDKILSDHFRKEAEAVLHDSSHTLLQSPGKIPKCSFKFWFGFLVNWAMLFHLSVTAAFIIFFYLLKQ